MATMGDVARRAGVSLSTVSYVISGRRPISEPTKKRVARAMEETQLHPQRVRARTRGSSSRHHRVALPL